MSISFHRKGFGRRAGSLCQIEYGFPSFAANVLGVASTADLHHYFACHGVGISEETCRRLLRGQIRSTQFELWTVVCDITGESLSSFIDYHPQPDRFALSERPPARARRRRSRRAARVAGGAAPPPRRPRLEPGAGA